MVLTYSHTLRRYVKTIGQNQEDEPTFDETVDVPFLQSRVDRAKKVRETMKAKRMTQKVSIRLSY